MIPDAGMTPPNNALHWTAFPLRSKAASELGRYTSLKISHCN